MAKIKYYFILILAVAGIISCSKSDDDEVVVARPYNEQYATDIANIEEYLKTYYIESVTEDYDVTLTKIPEGGTQTSVWDQTTYELKSKDVDLHGIVYKLYYLVLNKGTGDSPCNTDGVLAAYDGSYISKTKVDDVETLKTTDFEKIQYPQNYLNLYGAVMGWGEVFPEFKKGTYENNPNGDGTVLYKDFGAGVMFLPSGLGYYASGSGSIPAYSPLIFSFKLFEIKRLDQDNDGVLDMYEDLNGDGYVRDYRNTTLYPNTPVNPDDTDGDGVPDFIDIDDDGDGYTTYLEIKNPLTNLPYDFDEIPTCDSGKKNYLDATCHP